MGKKYPYLTSPIAVNGRILKSRLISSNSMPHFIQGPEPFPSESLIAYVSKIAQNGAAIVTIPSFARPRDRHEPADIAHIPYWDHTDAAVQNYITQLADCVHFHGSLLSLAIGGSEPWAPPGYDVCDMEAVPRPIDPIKAEKLRIYQEKRANGNGLVPTKAPSRRKAMTRSHMNETIRRFAEECQIFHSLGFDMCSLYMPYNGSIGARFLSPKYNKRTDDYGGSIENRARFILEMSQAIKDACGKSFLIEAVMTGEETDGFSLEDAAAFAKLAEGYIDIIQLRAETGNLSHPVGLNSQEGKHITMRAAEAMKKTGTKVLIAPIGGYQNPDEMERYLREHRCDMFAAARTFICDPDFWKKLIQNRGDDVVPCIKCNICHGISHDGPWQDSCSVNPKMGLESRLPYLISPPGRSKRVAVIGGGPAGMVAALTAQARGHQVTLFEAGDRLGGQLFHTDYVSFKWPLRRYRDFLAYQMEKQNVEVMMNTRATPELLKDMKFDAVVAAVGAAPNIPPIPGLVAEDETPMPGVWKCIDVYGKEELIGTHVIVIGGSDTAVETALHLAEKGHRIIQLSRQAVVAYEAHRPHYYTVILEKIKSYGSRYSVLTEATTVKVEDGAVVYRGKDGVEHRLRCDSILFAGGMNSLQAEALAFSDCAPEFYLAGDCQSVGSVRTAVRTAFAAASQI